MTAIDDVRASFLTLLHRAITQGLVPLAHDDIGPATLAAIRVVAHEHPFTDPHHIVGAYDAFGREHLTRDSTGRRGRAT